MSGAGLTWTLLMRSNAQSGTAEIWVAHPGFVLGGASVTSQPTVAGYHGSLVVIAFSNAAGGRRRPHERTLRGAGHLPARHLGRQLGVRRRQRLGPGHWADPVAGQVLVHQRVDSSVGDTFWVQSTAAPSTANALVDIHDSAPTTDQWNFAAVEIVATRP